RVLAATVHQSLCLRKRVRDKHRLLIGERVGGTNGNDELDRRLARSLMQPLEECVLAVGARLSPKRSGRRAGEGAPVTCDALAVAFEDELLQIGGESRECL